MFRFTDPMQSPWSSTNIVLACIIPLYLYTFTSLHSSSVLKVVSDAAMEETAESVGRRCHYSYISLRAANVLSVIIKLDGAK